MTRPGLLVAALLIGLALTGEAGTALAEDQSPGAGPSAGSSGGPAVDGASGGASPTGDPTADPTADPSADANQAPVAHDDSATVAPGRSVTVDVLANDTDDGQGRPAGTPQYLSVQGTDADPRLSHDDKTLTFRAGDADTGRVEVSYTVTDGELTDTGRLTIDIQPPATRTVSIAMPQRVVALKRYSIHGVTRPTVLGRPVVKVQRRKGDRWVTVGKDRADVTGRYAVGFRTNRPVKFVFRAVATWGDGKVRRSDRIRRVVDAVADPHVSGPLKRSQVPYSWRSGCPVPPKNLRRVSINRITFDHTVARGAIVVRASAADAIKRVFTAAINRRFPVKSMHPTDFYYDKGRRTPTQSDLAAMRAGNTAAFNCRPVTGNPYRISQHSYGNAIDVNTIQNPYVTGSQVYPSFARSYLDRSPYRKGMILRGGVIAATMADLGWPWGARWSHPDYQHFSSNGG